MEWYGGDHFDTWQEVIVRVVSSSLETIVAFMAWFLSFGEGVKGYGVVFKNTMMLTNDEYSSEYETMKPNLLSSRIKKRALSCGEKDRWTMIENLLCCQ
jgi:hypothetical protein